jgi:outer membrane protein insertion porin family
MCSNGEFVSRRRADAIEQKSRAGRVVRTLRRCFGAKASTTVASVPLLTLLLFGPATVRAQGILDDELSPRVESIEFVGTSALNAGELRDAIVTEGRSCKNVFYTPICWISDAGTFENQPRLDREELQRDELRVRVEYWRSGYRQAAVSTRTIPAGEGVDVIFEVVEGPPTIVSRIDVVQQVALLDPDQVRAAGLPEEGRPLDVLLLDTAQVRLSAALFQQGYADAIVRDTVRLSPDGLSAAVEITVQPNARTTVESVAVEGNQAISDRTVDRLVDLREGGIFRRQDLSDAQRRLYRSELFRQAILRVPEAQDSSKQVVVTVREAPRSAVRLGVGFTTTDFVQGQARFTRYNWRGGARRLDVNTAVGNLLAPQLYGRSVFGSAVPRGVAEEVDDAFLRPTWQLSAEVSQPWFFSTRNSVALGIFGHRRSVPGIVVDQGYGVTGTFTREVIRNVTTSLNYRFERTQVDAGDLYFCVNFGVCRNSVVAALQGTQNLSPVRLSALIDRADDPLAPQRGWTGSLEAEHASAVTGSDFHFNRATAEVARYQRVGPGVLAGRVRLGWVRGSGGAESVLGTEELARTLVHPRKRLYAGGSTSVRGFGENLLGPRVLTIDPQRLIDPADATRGTPCTVATIAAATCDPNVAPSDDFLPRPLGGSSLSAASIEYRLPLTPTITGALFVDAAHVGDAGLNIPSGAATAVTPGFGFRYGSPIGPIRVDLGIRPDLAESLPVVTQVVEADGELRLVQLETLKDYDPVESTGSFFRKALNRLQLHLSIGEAF